jgi:hypothetical protein
MTAQQLGSGDPDGVFVPSGKFVLFGTTPVSQPATIAAATNTTTTTSTTTALTTDLDSLRSKFNDLLVKLKALGVIASA